MHIDTDETHTRATQRQATFHQTTQRFAVGTVDALVVIFDVRTATKWRVLEGHEGAINAVTFDGAGQRLASFSAQVYMCNAYCVY